MTIPPKVAPDFDWTTPEGQWMAWANNELAQLKLRIQKLESRGDRVAEEASRNLYELWCAHRYMRMPDTE